MKGHLIIFSCLILLSCQTTSPNQEIEDKVEKYIKSIHRDNSSYKPITFSEVDSAFTSVKNTSEYKRRSASAGGFEALAYICLMEEDDSTKFKLYMDTSRYYNSICDSLKSIFNPDFIGWKIQHIYQTKNQKNESVVNNFIFYFDKELQQIVNTEQVYKELPLKTYNQDTIFYRIKSNRAN